MPRHHAPRPLIFSLLDSPAFGGAEQYLWAHLEHLNRCGHPVVVASNNTQVKSIFNDRIKQRQLSNFNVIDAPYLLDAIGNWKGLLKFFWSVPAALWWCWHQLRHLKQEHRTIVCYWAGFSDRLVFSPLAKWLGCHLVWIEIGPLEPTFAKNWGFPRWLYRRVQHLPNHLVTTSRFTLKSMVRAGLPANKITLVYPNVSVPSLNQLQQWHKQGQSWLRDHQLDHKLVVAWVGRLANENELEVLLHAVAKLKRDQTLGKIQVVIIGDGPERQQYQRLANQLGIQDHLTWAGFVSETEKFSLLAASQVFVFTRAWELDGFGMTTIEAMAAGLPVITSRFGPQLEVVDGVTTGLLFTPHRANDLAKKLRQLASNISLRRKFSARNHRTLQPFLTATSLAQLDQVISSLPTN